MEEAWQETRRWNWGLEEDLTDTVGEDADHHKRKKLVWSKPHLPEISMSAMNQLMKVLTPGKIYLDAQVDTLDEAIEFICHELHDMQHFSDEKVEAIRVCLQRHHEMRTTRHKYHKAQKASPKHFLSPSPEQRAGKAKSEPDPLNLDGDTDAAQGNGNGTDNSTAERSTTNTNPTAAYEVDDDEEEEEVRATDTSLSLELVCAFVTYAMLLCRVCIRLSKKRWITTTPSSALMTLSCCVRILKKK